jgi:D-tyrosyl-tRNA(Tyr) deacylase
LQRVKSASVTVDGQLISQIGKGLLVLAAISKDDTEKDVESMASKILKAKLWDDPEKGASGRVSGSRAVCCTPG